MTSQLLVRNISMYSKIYIPYIPYSENNGYICPIVIISAFDPLLLKIENDKNYKRIIRRKKLCNFKNILQRGRYLVVGDIWVSLFDG